MRFLFFISIVLIHLSAFAQKPYVELILSPEKVEVDETFTVTVKSNVQGNINIDLPENFVNGNSVMNRMEQEIDQYTGEIITFLYYSRSGSMSKAGKYTFGPAYVRRGNKVYRSNIANLDVKEIGNSVPETADKYLLHKPACGRIMVSKKEVYIGEPLCLEAKVMSKFSPTHYESYDGYSTNPISEMHDLDKNQQVTVRLEGIGKNERFVFEHDKKVIFPQVAGKLIIEPFEMMLQSGFDSYPVSSPKTMVTVKKLPAGAPKSFDGALGKYSLSAKTEAWTGKEGEVVPLEITLKGSGNIHDVRMPKPKLPASMELYGDPEIKENYEFTSNGSEGEIQVTYYIKTLKKGVFQCPKVQFSYFNVEAKKYVVISSPTENWTILENPTKEIEGEKKEEPLVFEKYSNSKMKKGTENSSSWITWVSYSTSALLLGLLFIGFARKKKEQNKIADQLVVNEIVPGPTPVHLSSNMLSDLTRLAQGQNEMDFYVEAKKAILSHLANMEENELSSERSQGFSELKSQIDGYIYGGLAIEGGPKEFLNRLEQLLQG